MSSNLRDQLQATLSGTHTLERELGGGGMSKVFVAEEIRLGRKVVVKVLSPELAQGISVERFEREIKTVAALQQANIVPVISAGDTNGLPFYTMPFVTGESLRARLGRGPLAINEVVSVMRDVARALAFAHRQGVVHRDIKPDNVLLSEGAAVVTDFGIAKAISAARTSGVGATLTQVGTSIGTPAYMAPEQAAGDPEIDHRADIYSLGAMAYELLSGQAVFANRTPQRMLAAHMSETPVPVSTLRPDTPQQLAELVMRCLAKETKDRPQDATQILLGLETTSGGSMQAMPAVLMGGPGMFKKALAIYAGAFVAVAILAKAAIVGIGLPDWVFPGSLIVMALGLPVILWTGYVQRVARRAATATPTYTPGGTSAVQHGTMATMALKAAPRISWYRTARGGAYAMGAFVVMIGAFMGMRAFGIGPFGSLIATGALTGRDKLVIADFTVSNGDSALGRVVGAAIRAGLTDSRIFTLMTSAEIGAALQRMQRGATSHLDLETARQLALREGAKAIIDGDVTIVGTSYIVAARLVTADSARELASFRGTASGSDAIITVADDISRKLRSKAGESLRRVQATPTLAYATTSSLEALRKYSDAARANDVERDFMKAVRLLREAVALDSNFAEAWRKLAQAMGNSGAFLPSVRDSAMRRAFALSGRMTERERDLVHANYYSGSPGYDRAKAIATYERMLLRGDSVVGLNNLGGLYASRRQFAQAERVRRAAIKLSPGGQLLYVNLMATLNAAGEFRARDSLLAEARRLFPRGSSFTQIQIGVLHSEGRIDEVLKALDSARKVDDPRTPSWAVNQLSGLNQARGRLREATALSWQAYAIDSTSGSQVPRAFAAAGAAFTKRYAGLSFDAELKVFDTEMARFDIESRPLSDRPYLGLASLNAALGRVDAAKRLLARHDAVNTDTAYLRWSRPNRQEAEAAIAWAERKWADAARLQRLSDQASDGPNGSCVYCLPLALVDLFVDAAMPDSAIAAFDAYRKTPQGSRLRTGPDLTLGVRSTEALAKMFDSKGNAEKAAELYREFIEMWKDADPELQPRVKAARDRLAKLTPVERPR